MSRPNPIDGSNMGYVRLHRKILDNPLFRDKPAEWFKIWIYILLRANWRESVFRPRQGDPITVPAGSLVTSLEKLGTHAGLTKEHARRCLDYLERAQRNDTPNNTPMDNDKHHQLGNLPAIGRRRATRRRTPRRNTHTNLIPRHTATTTANTTRRDTV